MPGQDCERRLSEDVQSILEGMYLEASCEKLLAFLLDERPQIRIQAALRLKKCGAVLAARTLAVRIQMEPHPEVKRVYLYAIAFMDKRTATRWLSSIVATTDDETVLYYGLHTLHLHGLKAAWAALPLLTESRPAVLFAAVQYLQSFEPQPTNLPGAIARLRNIIDSCEVDWKSELRGDYFKGKKYVLNLLDDWTS